VAETTPPAPAASASASAEPAPESAGPSATPADRPSPSPPQPQPTPLGDGRHFGYIARATDQPATVQFDLAYFLTGEEANAAAAEDGVIAPGESIENDYYIVNDNPQLRTLPVAAEVTVDILGTSGDPSTRERVSYTQFLLRTAPDVDYWVTVEGGQVVGIEQQFRP
jgi:hypothetical protein